jgi:hypothetical protein
MALNLWKLGTGVTSYNPLPIGGIGGAIYNLNIGDYIIKFKAHSPSGARMYVQNNSYAFKIPTLTPERTEYVYEFRYDKVQNLYLRDPDNVGDIIIEDIQLVEKPLPKLTINGIAPFTDPAWKLHANAKVIDDETLELDATAAYQASLLDIPVLPNTTYSISHEVSQGGQFVVQDFSTKSYINDNTFKTSPNTTWLRVWFQNTSSNPVGKFTFKRPMLNLGTTPAPYEPKRGERMVLPVPKNNLLPNINEWEVGSLTTYGTDVYYVNSIRTKRWYPIEPNTEYVFSSLPGYEFYCTIRETDGTTLSLTLRNGGYFKTNSRDKDVRFLLREIGHANPVTVDLLNNAKPQLEQGTIATPYEPYVVQLNPKPKRLVPKKNLFDGQLESGIYNGISGIKTPVDGYIRSVNMSIVKPNTDYIISNDKGYMWNFYYYDGNKQFIAQSNVGLHKFTTPPNCHYVAFRSTSNVNGDMLVKIQLEQGSTPTQFEPYALTLPPSRTGLRMDGTQYVQLPSMTMDSIEIDCVIDSNGILLDARSGLPGGFVYHTGVPGTTDIKVIPSVLPIKERVKVHITMPVTTDDVTLFSNYLGAGVMPGTLYSVKCYLNGQVVAEYDFTNPNSIVGDKLLVKSYQGTGKNLFNGAYVKGTYITTNPPYYIEHGIAGTVSAIIEVNSNEHYTISKYSPTSRYAVASYSSLSSLTNPINYKTNIQTNTETINTGTGAKYLVVYVSNTNEEPQLQIEKGTTATPFEPYQLVEKQGGKNLIPAFDSGEWSLHSNFKVFGPNVGRLDASGSYQYTIVNVPVIGGKEYYAHTDVNPVSGSVRQIIARSSTKTALGTYSGANQIIKTPTNTSYLEFQIGNLTTIRSFDFIKPELYELTGKEATIYGNPTPLQKAPKRLLYAKR